MDITSNWPKQQEFGIIDETNITYYNFDWDERCISEDCSTYSKSDANFKNALNHDPVIDTNMKELKMELILVLIKIRI